MGLLKMFVKKEKIEQTINDLADEKTLLKKKIENQLEKELLKMFPDEDIETIKSKHAIKLEEIEKRLYEEYSMEINKRINQLDLFKNRLYSSVN